MTELQILRWIKDTLAKDIQKAITQIPDCIFSEADLAGITVRETGALIARYVPVRPPIPLANIFSLMRGDFTQRQGEPQKQYHGYGLTQVDIASFPDFVKSGDWKIPFKCYQKSLQILQDKKHYITAKFPTMEPEALKHAIISSYNEGEGNARKALDLGLDSDVYTTGHDYATSVAGYAQNYLNLV